MAKDHFKEHAYQKDRVDWNFNILVDGQSDVARMAGEYRPTLSAQEGLHDPIPPEWLHMTVLRVGTTDDYTEQEMLRVVDILKPKLAAIQLPELMFDSWWQWGGNIVFHISPHDQLKPVYEAVVGSLEEVVGRERTTISPHGSFIPHITFAYTKDHDSELATNEALASTAINPAMFRASSLALIRQWPIDGHYEWEIVRDLAIGAK